MLTLQRLSRQLRGCHGVGVTLLPGCMVRLAGDVALGRDLLQMIAGKRRCPKGSILFAHQETRGDAEFFSDLFYIPACTRPYWFIRRRTVKRQLEKWSKKSNPALLETAIHFFKLSEMLESPIGKLNESWWQRVRLAQLLLDPCTLWLLEAPLAKLDEEGKQIMEVLIAGRCKQNGIVLFTHQGETTLNPHVVMELT